MQRHFKLAFIFAAAAGLLTACAETRQTVAVGDVPLALTADWDTAVIAVQEADSVVTGAVRPSQDYRPQAGPRLTGPQHALTGIASYYWQDQMTATGERFDKRAMTAAHKTLPFGTRVRVTRADTGKSVVVRINDRGPYKPGRVIDLSEKAAEDLGMTGKGVTPVKLEVLGK